MSLRPHLHLIVGKSIPEDVADELNHLLNGEFSLAYGESKVNRITSLEDLPATVKDLCTDLSEEDYSQLLVSAIACLQTFVQTNFTGPSLKFDPYKVIAPNADWSAGNDAILDSLASDGEPAFRLMSYPYLLQLSGLIFENLANFGSSSLLPIAKFWYARCLSVQQSTLSGLSYTLRSRILDNLNDTLLKELKSELTTPGDAALARDIDVRYYTEIAKAHLTFGNDELADGALKLGQAASGFEYVLTGIMGKRTKFQLKDTSQLILLAKSADNSQPPSSKNAPAALALDSDLLLEQPAYSAPGEKEESSIPESLRSLDPNSQPALDDIDSAMLLLWVEKVRKSSPHRDAIVQERLTAMVNRIINSPESSVNWTVFSRSLWNRSLLESDSPKTVERGTLQMQSLVEELGQANSATYFPKASGEELDRSEDVHGRLQYIYQLPSLPKWAMDSALADKFMSLGLLKSALEVYQRLEMWAEKALCLAAVGRSEDAVEVMQEHLSRHPSDARGWSVLGDITLNPEFWEKAWDLGKYVPAKRSLGKFYYSPPRSAKVERDLTLAIRHLNDALKINPLNEESWFIYGCAGLETSQWELASEAFSRTVALDDSNAKAWTNLSSALLQLGKKTEAFSALKRATKASSDSNDWRIWTNYVTVAGDLGDWAEAANGMKKIISIRGNSERGIELPLLEQIVQQLVQSDLATDGKMNHFQKTVVELVTTVLPAVITEDPRLWSLHARVSIWMHKPWTALESYEKAFRIAVQGAEGSEKAFEQAVLYCGELVDAYLNLGELEGRIEGSLVCKDWKFKSRSAVRSVMGKGKNLWDTTGAWDKLMEIKEGI